MSVKPLALVALFTLAIAACLVHRPSEDFTCSSDTDCTDGRHCDGTYCIEPNCPDDCDFCDAQQNCVMNCSTDDNCGSVNCPDGFTCMINCIGDGACDDVRCSGGSKCTINCLGSGACRDVTCRDACQCDLTCASGACDAISCPNGPLASKCTTDGAVGSPCDSSAAGCTKC